MMEFKVSALKKFSVIAKLRVWGATGIQMHGVIAHSYLENLETSGLEWWHLKFLIRTKKTLFYVRGPCKEVTYKLINNKTKRIRLGLMLVKNISMEWPTHTNLELQKMIPPPQNSVDSANRRMNLLKWLQNCTNKKRQPFIWAKWYSMNPLKV